MPCTMNRLIVHYSVAKHTIHYNKSIKNILNFQISIKFYVVIIRPFFFNHLGLTRAKKCAIVVRLTPHCSANFRWLTPMSSCCIIQFFRPNNLHFFMSVRLPFGLPKTMPWARRRANASLVRWQMSCRSISADSPKANARTLLCMSSPRR